MNGKNTIGTMVLATILATGLTFAQQSNSVRQTVTFGVSRSTSSIVNTLSSGSGLAALRSASGNMDQPLGPGSVKVTISPKWEGTETVSSVVKGRDSRGLDDRRQLDVRNIAKTSDDFFRTSNPLIVTITD